MPPKRTSKRQRVGKKRKTKDLQKNGFKQTKLDQPLKGGSCKGLKQGLLPLEPPPVKRRPGSTCEDFPDTKSTKTPTGDELNQLDQSSLKRRHDQEKDEDGPKLKLMPISNVDNELQNDEVTFNKTCHVVLEDCIGESQENHASLDISNEESQMDLSSGKVGTSSTSGIEHTNCTVEIESIGQNTGVVSLTSSTALVGEGSSTSGGSLARAPLRSITPPPPTCALESCNDVCEKNSNGTYYRYCSVEHSRQNGKKKKKRRG